jgi:diguanylate cyclase (GGDEF)-like protein/putative nucleotidyltransferase with HDIG domain
MGNFAYIPIIALLCYSFLLLAFLAAKKSPLINAFLGILLAMILWTGGSFFMRRLFWPSLKFWYDASILGLTLLPYSFISFVSEFANLKRVWMNRLWLLLVIVINAVNIFTGFFLAAPEAVASANGKTVFIYHYSWPVVLLFAVCVAAFGNVLYILLKHGKKNNLARKQFKHIILGIVALFIGHIGIMFPFFKGFPLDIVAGVVNAFFIFYALYKRNIFQLSLLVSRGSCYAIAGGLSFVLFLYIINPMEEFVNRNFPIAKDNIVLVTSIFFTLSTFLIYCVLKHFIDSVFIKDEIMQAKNLKEFSFNVTKSLNLSEILEELVGVIQKTIAVKKVFICIPNKVSGCYEIVHSTTPLDLKPFSVKRDNPLVTYLESNNECILMSDFWRTNSYKSMWEKEKRQLQDLEVECAVPLMDDNGMVGIVLLSAKEKKAHFTYKDLSFLDSVKSIVSIAVKNSKLFEKVYLEARTDELTGLLNRKYFYEVLQEEYDKSKEESISLIILNIDDFKLYNQLYGNKEGDIALQKIAQTISSCVGSNGFVARYSGKEFAIILPSYDLLAAKNLAEVIRGQILNMNKNESDYTLKLLTVSGGICSIPYSASNLKQLVDNADMAVYSVKQNGKNAIMVYTGREQNLKREIKKYDENKENIYSEYASTIYALTAAIDTKDHYTFSHSKNVEYYATELAYAYGMNEDYVEIIREAALLHDIGKIGIPEHILNKPGKLTSEEYQIMKGHVEHSIGIIRHLPSLDYVIPAVIGHHERYDGNGYPRRISKEDIPLSARILCIADSFDAMISERPYKKPYEVSFALEILQEQAGLQFDPELVRIFTEFVNNGRIKTPESAMTSNRPVISVLTHAL